MYLYALGSNESFCQCLTPTRTQTGDRRARARNGCQRSNRNGNVSKWTRNSSLLHASMHASYACHLNSPQVPLAAAPPRQVGLAWRCHSLPTAVRQGLVGVCTALGVWWYGWRLPGKARYPVRRIGSAPPDVRAAVTTRSTGPSMNDCDNPAPRACREGTGVGERACPDQWTVRSV